MKSVDVLKFKEYFVSEGVEIVKKTGASNLELKPGKKVIYLLKGKKKEDYDGSKSPEEQKDVVEVKPIEKIEGDKIIFLNKDGEPKIKKTKDQIMGEVDDKGTTEEKQEQSEDNTEKNSAVGIEDESQDESHSVKYFLQYINKI